MKESGKARKVSSPDRITGIAAASELSQNPGAAGLFFVLSLE